MTKRKKYCCVSNTPEVEKSIHARMFIGRTVEVIGSIDTKVGPMIRFKTKSGEESQIARKFLIPVGAAT